MINKAQTSPDSHLTSVGGLLTQTDCPITLLDWQLTTADSLLTAEGKLPATEESLLTAPENQLTSVGRLLTQTDYPITLTG